MAFSEPKSPLTSADVFGSYSSENLAGWLDIEAMQMDGQPGLNNHVAATRAAAKRLAQSHAALAFVDKTIDNIAHGEHGWSNRQVVSLLDDIRSLILRGEVTPVRYCDCRVGGGVACTVHTNGSTK